MYYREVKHLSKGGMGSVFLVERKADGQKFAAKRQLRTHPADYTNAKAELVMLQKIDHPNIVKFEESFYSNKNNELILIIEYCPYGDLRGQLAFYKKQGILMPESCILWYMYQIMLGLERLHE